jgi:hypothetical protein
MPEFRQVPVESRPLSLHLLHYILVKSNFVLGWSPMGPDETHTIGWTSGGHLYSSEVQRPRRQRGDARPFRRGVVARSRGAHLKLGAPLALVELLFAVW